MHRTKMDGRLCIARQTMVVYDSERSLRERTSTSISDAALRQDASSKASVPTSTPSPAPASTRAPSAPSVDPGIAELTKQFAQLTLLLQANLNQPRGPSTPSGVPRTFGEDRKSTRLNSSHTVISYAVFCLKKKKKTIK